MPCFEKIFTKVLKFATIFCTIQQKEREAVIYVTGDTHGEQARILLLEQQACMRAGDTLIVCGDFGHLFLNDRNEEYHQAYRNLSKCGNTVDYILHPHDAAGGDSAIWTVSRCARYGAHRLFGMGDVRGDIHPLVLRPLARRL